MLLQRNDSRVVYMVYGGGSLNAREVRRSRKEVYRIFVAILLRRWWCWKEEKAEGEGAWEEGVREENGELERGEGTRVGQREPAV